LARELDLSYDWFENVMLAREHQTDWLVDVVEEHHDRRGFDHRRVGIYGRAFKAGTNLTVGSPATLLRSLLEERGFEVVMYDPHVDAAPCPFSESGVYVVATRHDDFASATWDYPAGSVVIDPWRFVPKRSDVEVVHVGVGAASSLLDALSEEAIASRNWQPAVDRTAVLDEV
jgi:UDPglucose 6-dehydrogenase